MRFFAFPCFSVIFGLDVLIAVITVAPTGKASFVYGHVQTRLRVNTMESDPLVSFMC